MKDRRTLARAPTPLLVAGVVAATACGPEHEERAPPACLDEPADSSCTERQYQPDDGETYTFAEIFDQSIDGRCNEGPCHDATEPKGDLDLSNEDVAYSGLLDPSANRVVPGDVTCGSLIVRLETPDAWYSMPPNNHLTEPERCVFRQWIASGAPR